MIDKYRVQPLSALTFSVLRWDFISPPLPFGTHSGGAKEKVCRSSRKNLANKAKASPRRLGKGGTHAGIQKNETRHEKNESAGKERTDRPKGGVGETASSWAMPAGEGNRGDKTKGIKRREAKGTLLPEKSEERSASILFY